MTTLGNIETLRQANLRLCRLQMWSNYEGYGVNLESSSKSPHCIQFVEPYSPAAAGGLRTSDVILAINNEDIGSMNYKQVINTIDRHSQHNNGLIELLVIEEHFYRTLIKRNIKFDAKFAHIINTPSTMPIDYQTSSTYQPRICEITINKSDAEFGFNIANGENNIGVYIEKIYPNTPVSKSLLRENDRIIEINDKFVDNNVSEYIKKKLDKAKSKRYVKLYVIDMKTYQYCQFNKISLASNKYRKIQSDKNLSTINRNDRNNREFFNDENTFRSSLSEEDIRLCTIIRADATDIFGIYINYHKKEHFYSLSISSGRNNGPSNAKLAGINDNDCLIEINGENIETLDHEQVKQRFSANKYPALLQILVTNMITYNYYKQQDKVIHPDLSTVRVFLPNIPRRSLLHSKYQSDTDDEESYFQAPTTSKNTTSSINVCKGDLVTQQTDVIVVCSSSQYLFDNICHAGGKFVSDSYSAALEKHPNDSVIAIKAGGKIASKRIYFLSWKADSDTSVFQKSVRKFVSDAIKKAAQERYQSIAFPAIGCGKYGCSISLVAQSMIEEADIQLLTHNISVLVVIQPERTDIYDEFQKQIHLLQPSVRRVKSISTTVGKGIIEVEQGDITMQKVDVIIGSSSSDFLRKAIIKAAGNEVEIAYNNEYQKNPNSILIATSSGVLQCKRIFFLKWKPDTDEEILQQSLMDLMSTVIQNMISYNFTSIAFPAIGCGKHGCSLHIVVKTMVKEMKIQLIKRNLSWKVKFVIQPNQPDIYDEFCKQVLITHDDLMESQLIQIPSTWETSTEDKIRFVLSTKSTEYKPIVSNFDQAMKGSYTEIIRIERIQNERWYMQYLAHCRDFKKRLNIDTEKRLYHGCPEQAAGSIIGDCFNRCFAGVNGTAYGFGVYFSSNAAYSHKFTRINGNGERCMFVARVLIGKTTIGDSSMKIRPVGYDSTTDNNHIFVTYHDTQALAEYLITYK